MASVTVAKSAKNPFMECGVGFAGLLSNLQNHPPEWIAGVMDDYETKRLEAIAQQASNVKEVLFCGLQSFGKVMALASSNSEDGIESEDVRICAWLISELSELLQTCDQYGASAEYVLAHGPMSATHSKGTS